MASNGQTIHPLPLARSIWRTFGVALLTSGTIAERSAVDRQSPRSGSGNNLSRWVAHEHGLGVSDVGRSSGRQLATPRETWVSSARGQFDAG
jgi:hypothetical protein